MLQNRQRQAVAIAILAGVVLLTGPAGAAPAPAPVPVPTPAPDDSARFYAFLREFRAEALAAGVSPATYDRATDGISLNRRVQELNGKQPEFVRPVWEYLSSAVSEERIARGRELIAANTEMFARLSQTYGLSPEILTAIWGMETGFGRNTGGYNIFEALATLAFEGPRAVYGRRQLIAALKLAEVEGRDPVTMTSSWAGAFGETQFVPTTFLERAVDGDGDGKRDVWHSSADALASTANYLKQSQWHAGETWGEEVQLPANFPYENADFDIKKPMSEWSALGVRTVRGEALPETAEPAAIFLPAGARGPAFLLRANFDVLLKYNFATSYALAVALLGDRLKGEGSIKASWPVDEVTLDISQRTTLQQRLIALGFDTGSTDGVLGRRTRQAIRDYQKAHSLPADGFATASLLTRVLNEHAN